MKILSWNVERPNNNPNAVKNTFIINLIQEINPDIIFLTETNAAIQFEGYYSHQSTQLPPIHENQSYKSGENRIAIFSKFPIEKIIATYDSYTAVCCEINSAIGPLILYGSIIGSFGGKDAFFKTDLQQQQSEIENLSKHQNLIYSGDFNISFSGFPYPAKNVIYETNDFFKANALRNITGGNENSVIHVVVSKALLNGKKIKQEMMEVGTQISDHNLVVVEID
ncbi:hypothetical protein FNO01nite_26370 [Flavobacterium noncentrifugens]|uniref:Endonuclease/Exonuclease/phosphatase family protein n=1 Tax=Flavobacterium noncentrifugens TaxID=1128970 RepID=A0A1G8ZF30_9FLAO|nr:endonuclease/exonuclease/phosphatase family protein [Flavobacterium noncentrifugens]GEP51965.1 hypothetical protein FNO01nite_26370 [Flavobacterium noncentrifugens]SDK13628.1 Endonuclease/Exonuclease/phosphatase family protein [Flavobacterium noncentrifugens]